MADFSGIPLALIAVGLTIMTGGACLLHTLRESSERWAIRVTAAGALVTAVGMLWVIWRAVLRG